MKWQRHDDYAQTSTDDHYSVAKVLYVTRTGQAWRYEAYRRRGHPDGPKCLATNLLTADAARAACVADLENA